MVVVSIITLRDYEYFQQSALIYKYHEVMNLPASNTALWDAIATMEHR